MSAPAATIATATATATAPATGPETRVPMHHPEASTAPDGRAAI